MVESNRVDTRLPPPLMCTVAEYQELHSLASSIESLTDAQQELLDCSRYGELDSVRALLDIWSRGQPDFVNTKNETGCTALHFAAANGHASVVHLLLSAGAMHLKNTSGGNTPLHWAAQNSHSTIVQLLLNHPPFRFHSKSQEIPQNEPSSCTFSGIDVLEKNDFGRSALTEGFGSRNLAPAFTSTAYDSFSSEVTPNPENTPNEPNENDQGEDEHTKLIGMLLEHDSATEDRLIGGDLGRTMDEVPSTETDPGSTMETDHLEEDSSSVRSEVSSATTTSTHGNGSRLGVIHEFNFGSHENTTSSQNILVRELPIKNADSPFGSTASQDTTGLGIWCASLVSARWLYTLSTLHRRFDDKVVLELGTGCGTPGLTVALCSRAHTVYLTDFNTSTMKNLQYNIDLNSTRDTWIQQGDDGRSWVDRVLALKMDWADSSTWPTQPVDCIIGADLIYQKSIVPLLKLVIHGNLKLGGSFFYVCPSDGRDGLDEFVQEMSGNGFSCVYQIVAPDEYKDNPLSNHDEEAAFLHFHELPVTTYMLYEFVKKNE